MRRERRPPTILESVQGYFSNWRGLLAATAAVIAVASAGVWLYRDARGIIGHHGPAKGELIVNINTATQDELATVPGIGPAKAAAIIAGRPYATVDDIVRVNGIGPAQMDALRPFLKTGGETGKR